LVDVVRKDRVVHPETEERAHGAGLFGAADAQRRLRVVRGAEERDPLDVIPMEMREEEVDGKRPRAAAVHEGCAELAKPGAGIKNEKRSGAVANFNARGVAAVAHRKGTGRRDGPTGTPEPDLQLMLTIWSPDLARKG